MTLWRALPLLLCLASPAGAEDLRTFAICTGRLSALMEHQWLMQEPGADRTRAQRDAFADLVQALASPDQLRGAMALRIEAKAAMAQALVAVDLGGQARQRPRLVTQLRACLRLLPQV